MAERRMATVLACLCAIGAAGAADPPARDGTWVYLGESESATHYFDPATVRPQGERKWVWRLFDQKNAAGTGIRSGKALIEVDCKEQTYRYLRTMYFGGSMGRGAYLGGSNEQAPEYIAPGSMIGYLAKAVC